MVVIFTVIVLLYIQVHNFVPVQTQENQALQDSCSDIVEKDRNSRTENPEVNESIPDSAGEMAEGDDSYLEEWQQAYLNYLEEDNYADIYTYSLIYVDDDDIPEMVVDTGGEAGGCQFLTFHDHVLDVWQSARLEVTYIERGNLICNSSGNMGYYYDNVYAIQDGKWVYVDGGIWGDGPDGVQIDENGNYLEFFYWTEEEPWSREEYWFGEEITREEYEARLNAIYPKEQRMYPQKYYVLDELKLVLRMWPLRSIGMN